MKHEESRGPYRFNPGQGAESLPYVIARYPETIR